jgi:citronellol/citronellal dehydrogenase
MSASSEKLAVVAGAGSGIGQGCALRLAGMDYRVVLVGRKEEKLAATATQIEAGGGRCEMFSCDVRNWDRLGELNAHLAERGVDVLINCAGGQFLANAVDISRNGWQAVVDTNLSGGFFLCRQLYPALKRRSGSVVLVVANLWQRAAPGFAHSGAARAGVVSLARTLAIEWAPDRIRVNAVSPGVTDTSGLRNYPHHAETTRRVPLGRLGTVEEIVDAILFMGLSPYITGEVLTIDGGLQLVT